MPVRLHPLSAQTILDAGPQVFNHPARLLLGLRLGDEAYDRLGVRAADEQPALGKRHLDAVAQFLRPARVLVTTPLQNPADAIRAAGELLLDHEGARQLAQAYRDRAALGGEQG